MANNRKGVAAEERLERSCRMKMEIIRGLIRGQESAEDRALCANWLKFLSRSAKDEARARDCLLEQMVRQLRELGHLSLPFTTQANCRTELRLLLDEEGRQRLRRLNPPVVVAPQSSRTGLRNRRSRRSSPFVWRQRVQHLNTLEEQYRREEQELWRNEFSTQSQTKEGTDIKEVGVQVDMPMLSPRGERDLLDRARKQQEIRDRRERERLERQQRDVEHGRQRAILAEQRQSERQRREETRQLRERHLLEQQLKVKERRDHERKLLSKRREARSPRSPPQQDLGSILRAHRQKQDEVKGEMVVNRHATKVNVKVAREVEKIEPDYEGREQERCRTCDRNLPPDADCVRCEIREQQALLRAENVKQKVMAYEQLKQYHRERALAERARIKKDRLDQEKEEQRREIEEAERRRHKRLASVSKPPDEPETKERSGIDALDVPNRQVFEMFEGAPLENGRLDQEKEQCREVEEGERRRHKELPNVKKLPEEPETKERIEINTLEKERREVEKAESRRHKGLASGSRLPDESETKERSGIDAREASNRQVFEVVERAPLKKGWLEQEKEEKCREVEEGERRRHKELPNVKKLPEEPETKERIEINTLEKERREVEKAESRRHKGLASGSRLPDESETKERSGIDAREASNRQVFEMFERAPLKKDRLNQEKEEQRNEIEEAEIRRHKELPNVSKKPEEPETKERSGIDALEVSNQQVLEMFEKARLKKERLDREKEEQCREIEEAEKWCRKELENLSKLRKEQETKKKTDVTVPKESEVSDKRKEGEGRKRKTSGETDQKGMEELEDIENEAREKSEQIQKVDLQRKSQEADARGNNDLEVSDLRELQLLQKWNELREKYKMLVGEQSPTEKIEWRKRELRAKKEFLREATEHTEQIKQQIREELDNRKKLSREKFEERLRKEKEERLIDKRIGGEFIKERKAKEKVTKQQEQRMAIPSHLELQLAKNQIERGNAEEHPPGDRNSEQADDKLSLLRARKEFLTKLEQMSQEEQHKPASQSESDPHEDVRSRLKDLKVEKDQLTKQIRDRCQELQKQRLERAKAGSELVDVPRRLAKHGDLGSHSWKKAQENWLQADIIKEKCLQDLEIIEAALQRKHQAGEEAASATILHPHESPEESTQTPQDQPHPASAGQKKPKAPKTRSKRWVRFKDSEEGSKEEVTARSSSNDHSMTSKACIRKETGTSGHENTKSPCPGAKEERDPRRYSDGSGVTYCTQTGRKRYPQFSQQGVSPGKAKLFQRRIFGQLLAGSRPTDFHPKSLTADIRILKRKLSVGKAIALKKRIQQSLMLRASRLIDLLLKDKAKARRTMRPPRPIFQALIDPLLQGMESVSRRVLENIILLDGQLEAYLRSLCNSSLEQKTVPEWRGLPHDEHLVSDLFYEFRDLDPKLNKSLKRVDQLYRMWKDQRLNFQ